MYAWLHFYIQTQHCRHQVFRVFFEQLSEGRCVFQTYQWGKPQPRDLRGEWGGGKFYQPQAESPVDKSVKIPARETCPPGGLGARRKPSIPDDKAHNLPMHTLLNVTNL